MRTQSCKAKGRKLQQMVAADILTLHPSLTAEDVRSTPMGSHGEDVQLSSQAKKLFPFSVEAKNQERMNVWTSFEQCEKNCSKEVMPLLVFKKNRSNPLCALRWKDFLSLIAPSHLESKERDEKNPCYILRKLADRLEKESLLSCTEHQTADDDVVEHSKRQKTDEADGELARHVALSAQGGEGGIKEEAWDVDGEEGEEGCHDDSLLHACSDGDVACGKGDGKNGNKL